MAAFFAEMGHRISGEFAQRCAGKLHCAKRLRCSAVIGRCSGDGRFRQVYERAPIGIVLVDQSGKFIEANPAFAKMIGYSRSQLSKMTVAQVTYPQDLGASKALIRKLLEGRRGGGKLEKRYLCKNGNVVWGRLSV